jgi:hypothetical protein
VNSRIEYDATPSFNALDGVAASAAVSSPGSLPNVVQAAAAAAVVKN